jgi:HlyD family secretion protein
MICRFFLRLLMPILATWMLGFALWKAYLHGLANEDHPPHAHDNHTDQSVSPTFVHDNRSADSKSQVTSQQSSIRVMGVGIVEPPGQKVNIGFPQSGLVSRVCVAPGDVVDEGAILVEMDARAVLSDIDSKKAEWLLAKAKLDRLQSLPRPETVRMAVEKLESARVSQKNALDQLERMETLARVDPTKSMVSQEELQSRRFAEAKAMVEVRQAQAELDQTLIGATEQEKRIAQAEIDVAYCALQKAEVANALLTIRAPHPAAVLRCDLHAGEFVDASRSDDAPLQISAIGSLHVRTEFDEEEAAKVPRDGIVHGLVRSRVRNRLELKLVRFEPVMHGKKNLMGHGTERVDTRTLQAIYEVVTCEGLLRPGQAVDVFVESMLENAKNPIAAK